MKHLRFHLLSALLCLVSCAISAANVLRVDSVKYPAGKTVSLPILLENQADIAGVQFDIAVPYELSTDDGGNALVQLAPNRAPYHRAVSRKTGTQWRDPATHGGVSTYHVYRIIVFSDDNQLIIDREGALLTLQLPLPIGLANESKLPVYLIDGSVTLSDRQKQNVATGQKNGLITVEEIPRPDLAPTAITFAPATINAGDKLTVSWQVQNIGTQATGDGWSEQIALTNLTGTLTKTIATIYYSETLAAKASVDRKAEIDVPAYLGIDGVAKVQVTVVPYEKTGEHPSLQDNNSALSQNNIDVAKRLTLELSRQRVAENSGERITAKLSRSGRWDVTRTFSIKKTPADNRLAMPENVTIPAGQSGVVFYIDVQDNDVVDADSIVTLSVSGDSYEPATAKLIIEDNEFPPLTVKASQSVVQEGETFQLTISAPKAVTQDVSVQISSEDTRRFSFPSQAVIPAGQQSVTINVVAVDNDVPNLEQANIFTVSAQRYTKGEATVIVQDNDMPVLTLTLTPGTVSENAGPTAVSAVLRRTGKTDTKITVRLSDDSNGGLYYSNRSIEMAKGVEEVYFQLGPVDNIIQDGDRTYHVTAGVWVSSCSCSASGEQAGAVTSPLTVLDNDGLSLSLSSQAATVKEGDTTTLTLQRNTTDTAAPLTVTLSSDYDEGLSYPKSVTIAAGQQQATVEVTSKPNDVSGDSRTVVFTIAASGYASATCYVLITDQTLPDVRIAALKANPAEAVIGSTIELTATLVNDGAAPLPAGTTVKFYRRSQAEPLGTIRTEQPVAVGETLDVVRRVALTDEVGTQTFYAVANENRDITELVYSNNTSADVQVSATSPFTATVTTDKKVYKQGEKIIITGQLSGARTASAAIEVYFINDGARQTAQVTTDMDGAFTLEWVPYGLQSGHFIVGACFPGDTTTEEQATFDVYGLRRASQGYITEDVTLGETRQGTIDLVNPGTLALSGLKAEKLSGPADVTMDFDLASSLAANGQTTLTYRISGTEPTPGNDWQPLVVRVTSKEGAQLDITIYYYARSAKGNLVVASHQLITTMLRDQGRDYSFAVSNNGRGNSGKITLALPSWMQALTGATMPGLNQNDTATVVLRLTPTDDMQLNVPVTGRIGINCENGNGTYIDFNVTPVSDAIGTLLVDVTDEYTYYTDEAPHVAGAQIVLRNPVTGAIVAQGKSGDDGTWSIDLPEGYYQLNVTADNHDSYKNNILVDPSRTTSKVVCLSYQAIAVSWDVVETEVEDEYNIVTTVRYETNVPAPVVEVIEPDYLDIEQLGAGESLVYQAILTNKGLITANATNYTVQERIAGCQWEPMVENKDLTLTPQQSYVIPVKVTRMGSNTDTHGLKDRTFSVTEWSWDFNSNSTTQPVVEVTEPDDMADVGTMNIGDSRSHTVKLKNKGTVTVYDVSYGLPTWTTGDYKWEVTQFENLTLDPGGEADITVKVTRLTHDQAMEQGADDPTYPGGSGLGWGTQMSKSGPEKPCIVPTATDYRYECGPDGKRGWYPHTIQVNKKCKADNRSWYTIYGQGLGSPGGGGGGDSYNAGSNGGQVSIEKDCDPCTNTYLEKWRDCAYSFVPKYGCAYGLTTCYRDYKPNADWRYKTTCALTGVGCALEFCTEASLAATLGTLGLSTAVTGTIAAACGIAGTTINVVNCLISLTEPCGEHDETMAFTPFSWRAPAARVKRAPAAEPDWLTSYRLAAEIPAQEFWAYNAIMLEIFGEEAWLTESTDQELYNVLDAALKQQGTITAEQLRPAKPQGITEAQLEAFVERLNNSTAYADNGTEADNRIHVEDYEKYVDLIEKAEEASRQMGYKSTDEMWIKESMKFQENAENKGNSVCSTVSLQINQTMTMTRQAFRGTLTVYNGNKTQAMTNVRLKLNATNSRTQQVATAREFEIHAESLAGFKGDLAMDSGWHLGTDSTGTATIIFIPSKYAAPEEPVDYSFGGTLSYVDPYTDLEVTRELYPVTLTVKPSPELDLTYFMQRDIMGDNALTEEVEPMVPAEFAVIINNKGYGDATNVRMATAQPKIVENEKGLYIDFEFLSSQLNGQEKVLAMGETIPTDFGTIAAHSQAYAQWWLQSTLLGHFIDYDIEATHVTSYGNEDLSLLDRVSIHELVHGFTSAGEATGTAAAPAGEATGTAAARAFLVNDVADSDDQPDALYFTDATQATVAAIGQATVAKTTGDSYALTMLPTQAGWQYGSLLDPTAGRQKLASIVRQSDGQQLPLDNVWQTAWTIRDGREPVKDARLHFVANLPLTGDTYLLTFAPRPQTELAVEAIDGVPAEGTLQQEPLRQVSVTFNKAIKAETFTADDLSLACQGAPLDTKQIGIAKQSDTQYTLDLSALTAADGYYVLTVQTATITDAEGFEGGAGRQATWVQYAGGKVALTIVAQPAEGGTVAPASGAYDFGKPLTLTATANEGYDFQKWTEASPLASGLAATVSEQPSFSYSAKSSTTLTAVFVPKYFDVTITAAPAEGGTVQGGGTGRYAYGTTLALTAQPQTGYEFDYWTLDGKKQTTAEPTFQLTVTKAATVEAVFREQPGGVLAGRVTSSVDDLPIAGATVTLSRDQLTYTATTDQYGRYTLQVADRTLTYDVLCQADGYIWSPESQIWFTDGQQTKNFALLPGATALLPDDGICTFSPSVDVEVGSLPIEAWYVSSFDQQHFCLTQLTSGTVKAGEGLIIVGTGDARRLDMSQATTAAAITGNLLTGTAQAPYTVTADNVYVLRESTAQSRGFRAQGHTDLFFLHAAKGLVVPQGKAYVEYTVASGQPDEIGVFWSDVNLIESVRAAMSDPDAKHYDLQGRRIYKIDAPGKVHVVKGHKVIVK